MNAPEGDWLPSGRDYSLQRYSPLKQITTANVKDLKPVWMFSTGILRGHEGNPLVVGHVMYVNTPFPNTVYALDLAKPGSPMIWKYTPTQSPDAIPIACCDVVNRGVAYHPSGKILFNTLQGELIGLDAKTGKELWKATHPAESPSGPEAVGYKQGATMTTAPIVIKNVVIAGISGGEFGVRGRVSAFDVNTGKHLWTAYSTGPDSEVLIDGNVNANYPSHQGKDLGVLDVAGRSVEARRRTHLGLVLLRPRSRPLLLQHRKPGHLEPRPAAGRQQVGDDDFRPQARDR